MTHETHLNLTAERVQEAIDQAAPGEVSKLLISEAHLHSVNEVTIERNIHHTEIADPATFRLHSMNHAVAISRADYNTKPVEQVIREAALIAAYLTDGSVPEKAKENS
jgi:hypothetical protein